ncbi:MAG TPA: presqualene diphosphate synthase HpnD [Verrucomicrobiae bacterium]|nr:presqualene diphosphate synthase HpnD [Verrucomicrobiae bacterium]
MQHSRAITRKSASNLALAFFLLPKPKRDAMSALYAFCRKVDDVADEDSAPVEQRRQELARWRADVRRACENQSPDLAVNIELRPVIQRYSLPFALFDELIKGCEMDLEITRYGDFDQLELYCYRVASVVGLLSIEIFGYEKPATRAYAISLGKALQFTNILRDVKTDAARGRIYLPQNELKKFDVNESDILSGRYTTQFGTLAGSVADRAKRFYLAARASLPAEDRHSMVAAELMGTIYWRLLKKLERARFDVFAQPIKLSKPRKLLVILQSCLRFWFASATGKYGSS